MSAQTVAPAAALPVAQLRANDLIAALRRAAMAVAARPPAAVLSGVKLTVADGRLALTAFDYETSITTYADLGGGGADGSVLVSHRTLTSLIGKLRQAGEDRNPVIILDGAHRPGWLHVEGNGWRWPLVTLPMDEWPGIPGPDGPPQLSVTGVDMASALRYCVVAASHDETLPILSSVRFQPADGGVQLYSTDRYRLTRATVAAQGVLPTPFQLRRRTVADLVKHLSPGTWRISVRPSAGHKSGSVTITDDLDTTVTLDPVDGEYPKVAQLMPVPTRTVTVPRLPLLRAVNLVRELVERSCPAQLRITTGEAPHLVLQPASDEGWTALDVGVNRPDPKAPALPAELTGNWCDGATVHYSPSYLHDALAGHTGRTITIGLTEDRKPVLIGDSPEALADPASRAYLLMPVRVNR